MAIVQGWLDHAIRCPSPNCNARPDPGEISLLVIHNISLPPGQFGGPYVDELFTNTLNPDAHPYFKELEGLRVSAHALIRRDGDLTGAREDDTPGDAGLDAHEVGRARSDPPLLDHVVGEDDAVARAYLASSQLADITAGFATLEQR